MSGPGAPGTAWTLTGVEFVYRIATSAALATQEADGRFSQDAYLVRPGEHGLSVVVCPTLPQPTDLLLLNLDGQPVPGMFYGLERIPVELARTQLEVDRDSEYHASIMVGAFETPEADQHALFLWNISELCWRITRAEVNELRLQLGLGKY